MTIVRNETTERRTYLYRLLALLTLICSFILLSLPGSWIEFFQTWIHQWWPWPSSGLASSDFPLDKLVHATLFALCAALVVRGWTTLRQRWWLVCGLLFLYGALTELIQRFVPGRSSTLADLLADGIGVSIGVGFALMYLRKRPSVE